MNSLDAGHASPLSVQNTPNVVTNGVDAHPPVNGDIKHDPAASSPIPSPDTPVSTLNVASVKIDIDYHEQESDARNEPMPIKSETIENPNVVHTTIEQDVNMDEPHNETPMNGVNGNADHKENLVKDHDTQMATPTQTPMADASMQSINGASSPAGSTPVDSREREHDDEDQPPPAKRARMHSDADQASFSHNTPPPTSASPPPMSAVASHPNTPAPPFSSSGTAITIPQYKFAQSTVRSLKKMKDASPFLRPVDYIALNVPHYPQVIKHPMDFSTIERKLTASNPGKSDPNPNNPRYNTIDEFVNDVRLIFQNCITFNGPDHVITVMGKRVEEVFDKQLKHMPPAELVKPPPPKKATPPPPPPVSAPPPKKAPPPARRPSTSVPVIRRSDEVAGRPKREIHPPPPKDLAYADAPKKPRKGKPARDDGTADQLKFCGKLLSDLHKKQWYGIANPFYEPVDWLALDLPTYPKLIKKPMDLSTMRKKLEGGQYLNAQKFFDDFKLMIRNCFVFNPAGTPVNQAGIELQRLFDEKWKQLPPLRELMSEDDEDEDEEDSEDERQRAIADLESRIEEMRNNVAALKSTKKEKKKKEKKEKPPVASTSKPAAAKPPKAPTKKKSNKKAITENDALTFEQKKDLSDSISKLDEAKLEKVIQIIHEGVPEIRDSTEEIELEIDSLPPAVLTKLYNFVIRPMRQPAVKRNRTGKGTGTGGLKRKSMDEDVEAEKIRLLEERMALFNQQENGGGAAPTRQVDSDHSSDSSDSSDGSGSDSD